MGFFSWKTSDTKESIVNEYSAGCVESFLLQPRQFGDNIKEQSYGGYGVFGGVDAFEWLAETNTGIKDRDLGFSLLFGKLFPIPNGKFAINGTSDNKALASFLKQIGYENVVYFSTWDQIIEGTGKSANDLSSEGVVRLSRYIKYPLKFSFDENANYDKLEASEDCPNQGHCR